MDVSLKIVSDIANIPLRILKFCTSRWTFSLEAQNRARLGLESSILFSQNEPIDILNFSFGIVDNHVRILFFPVYAIMSRDTDIVAITNMAACRSQIRCKITNKDYQRSD